MDKEKMFPLRSKFIVLALLSWGFHSSGQVPMDARSASLGYARSVPDVAWAAACNPAGLCAGGYQCAGFSVMNRYLVEELKDLSFTFAYSSGRNGIGIAGSFSGFSHYFRQFYTVAYGRRFGERIRAGVSLDYLYLRVSGEYPALHSASFRIGFSYRLGEYLDLSFLGVDPFSISYASNKNCKIPSTYITSIAYHVDQRLLLVFEVEAGTEHLPVFKGACEYSHNERFFLRLGFLSGPFRITSGVGIIKSHLGIDVSFQYHPWLGFSPGLSVMYHRYTNENEKILE